MKTNNIIQQKSFDFAVKIIKLCNILKSEKKEFVISDQLLRSGTSIGANIEEAIGAQTKKDFFAKLTIAYKETRESHYWIRLLCATDNIKQNTCEDFLNETEELLKIIGSIQKTLRQQNKQ